MVESVTQEIFSFVDRRFALLFCHEEDACFILLCYLFASARAGHLCICIDGKEILPSPAFLTEDLAVQNLLQESCKKGLSELRNGRSFCSVIDRETNAETPIILHYNKLYLQRNWLLEKEYLYHLQRLQKQQLPILFDEEMKGFSLLTSEQALAVQNALSSPLTLLSGGPGTGKTFTAVEIIRSFLSKHQGMGPARIKLAAPTGKAAALLESRVRSQLDSLIEISCGTLHFFLKEGKAVFADLVIMDETSMVDAKLFVRFLSSLQGGRVVLMGDKDQLPPVETGGFFTDTLLLAPHLSIPTILLTKSLRTQNIALQEMSQAILKGDIKAFCSFPQVKIFCDKELFYVREKLVQQCVSFFSFLQQLSLQTETDQKVALDGLLDFCVLSALKKGRFGSEEINTLVHQRILQETSQSVIHCPILITKNDVHTGLVNGEVGIIAAAKSSWESGCFAWEDQAFFSGGKVLSASLLPSFSLGYALSIHKSQGSEYRKVLLVLPSGSERLGREVLYTGLTRAKQEVEILMEEGVISLLLKKSAHKMTGLPSIFSAS